MDSFINGSKKIKARKVIKGRECGEISKLVDDLYKRSKSKDRKKKSSAKKRGQMCKRSALLNERRNAFDIPGLNLVSYIPLKPSVSDTGTNKSDKLFEEITKGMESTCFSPKYET